MKKFITKSLFFAIIILSIITLGIFIIPTTPRASKSPLMASLKKDSLLIYTNPPRIIFIGGSNLSLGLNSQAIKDSLKLNPINTAINAEIGLKIMLDNSILYIHENDIVVLVPEYSHFYRDYNFVSVFSIRLIFDADKSKLKLLNFHQLINLSPYAFHYFTSKIKSREYKNFETEDNTIYGVNSFNEYGDAYKHWEKPKKNFNTEQLPSGKFNNEVIKAIKKFEMELNEKNAVLYISYPCFQEESFLEWAEYIKKIEEEYLKNNFKILGTPERYMVNDSLTYDSPYHLIKKGVDYRTKLLIEDLKTYLKN